MNIRPNFATSPPMSAASEPCDEAYDCFMAGICGSRRLQGCNARDRTRQGGLHSIVVDPLQRQAAICPSVPAAGGLGMLRVNRDRGAPRDAAPPTPPGIRVRTTAVRRINRLRKKPRTNACGAISILHGSSKGHYISIRPCLTNEYCVRLSFFRSLLSFHPLPMEIRWLPAFRIRMTPQRLARACPNPDRRFTPPGRASADTSRLFSVTDIARHPRYSPFPSTPCGDRSGLRPLKRPVGSEEARSIALALASVRRSNWTCSFPGSSFHEDVFL